MRKKKSKRSRQGQRGAGRLNISEIPDELLTEILRCLDSRSLKMARSTCCRWAKAGAYSLFWRIYFAPRRSSMELFKSITENPAFASNITELIYDARLFWGYMTDYKVYAKSFADG